LSLNHYNMLFLLLRGWLIKKSFQNHETSIKQNQKLADWYENSSLPTAQYWLHAAFTWFYILQKVNESIASVVLTSQVHVSAMLLLILGN
jgi:hypothetical protein